MVGVLVCSSCHSLNSCDKRFWMQYEKQLEGQEKACIYSSQRRLATFNDLLGEVDADAERLSREFEARHYVLRDDHPLSRRVQAALSRLKPVLAKRSSRGCSQDRPFPPESMTTHVIAHDTPVAFSFPNGKIYFTVGLVDPEFPWSAKTDDELLGVVAHEMIHLADWHVVAHWAIVRAALADNAQGRLPAQRQVDPIDSFDNATLQKNVGFQVFDLKNRLRRGYGRAVRCRK